MKNLPSATAKTFKPGALWLDNKDVHINAHGGGVLFHEGIYYWFGEHKIEGEAGNAAHVGVHVYSSADLYNWKDEGIALKVVDATPSACRGDGGVASTDSPITRGCILERPKVIYNRKTGKFVMWFHLEPKDAFDYSGAMSGVAVADSVTGPYQFVRAFRPNARVWPENVPVELKQPLSPAEKDALAKLALPGGPVPYYPKHQVFRRDFPGGQMARDMALFVDDDGSAYHLYASEDNGTLHISKLTEDFLTPAGKYVRVFPGRFHEAPTVFKAHGKYFLITSDCSGWAPNAARVAVADRLFGPWEELGNPVWGTNEQTATTFQAQGTFILRVQGKCDAFIFMADRWNPANAIDGRYIWLPIEFKHGVPMIAWRDEWDLGVFDK